MKKKETKINVFHKYLIISLLIITCLLLGLIYFIGILPLNYFIFATSIFVVIDGALILSLFKSKSKRKIIPSVISLIFLVFMMIGIIYEINTINFLKRLGVSTSLQNYSVVVLKESDYYEIKDLNNHSIGYLSNTENSEDALKELEKKIIINGKNYENILKLEEALLKSKVDSLLIETSQLSIIEEADKDFSDKIKTIYTYDIETVTEEIKKGVDVTKDSFNVYISGIDTYGSIGTQSRSDVNIVATINPRTHELHFTSIPRDYYVELPGKSGYKDKLTHAGIYGIDQSVSTIEKLLDIDINYYIKVNFSSVIKIVDTIGPIEVYSDYTFTTSSYDEYTEPYTFYQGKNILNGKQALAFSRERKSFEGGDRTRNENQEKVLEAIIHKALSPAILTKYTSLLEVVGDSFITNLSNEEITKLINQQLENNVPWTITSYVLDGTDSSNYTYSYSGAMLYVMEPLPESVSEGKSKLQTVFNNQK